MIGWAAVNLETNWGNFCADLCKSDFNTDLALLIESKTSIPAGAITLGQLEESLTDQITVIEISGATLKLALETLLFKEHHSILVSGFTFDFDGEASRIQTITLELQKIYTLATTHSLAKEYGGREIHGDFDRSLLMIVR